jgi:hypothetical protein
MLGWFIGRTLRANALRDIQRTQDTVQISAQEAIARKLAKRMASVEQAGIRSGIPTAIRLAEEMLTQATRDRHLAIARATGSLSDPMWLLAALSESWASARIAALKGKISIKAFHKVDVVIGQFLLNTLGLDEVSSIATNEPN